MRLWTNSRPRSVARNVLVLVTLAFVAIVVGVSPAAADTINFTGQGTTEGKCSQFEGPPPEPGGTQTWQFNLTQTMPGATMSASFSDGTSVTNIPEDSHTGKVSKWFITTAAGASVTSASASFTPDGPNSQLVVSHCTAGGQPPPPSPPPPGPPPGPPRTEGGVEVGGAQAERPPAAPTAPAAPRAPAPAPAAAVTAQPRGLTG